ncbi:hypothetical protein NXW60_03140 [Bacteroides fragilis]|nr:hypothetical protein NXW60_03140 [Bacteroides fragilis]
MTTLANTSFAATSGKGGTISGVPSSAQYLYFMANIKTDVGRYFPLSRERQVLMPDYARIVYKVQRPVTGLPMLS